MGLGADGAALAQDPRRGERLPRRRTPRGTSSQARWIAHDPAGHPRATADPRALIQGVFLDVADWRNASMCVGDLARKRVVLYDPTTYTPKFASFEYSPVATWQVVVPYTAHPDGTQIKAHMPYLLVKQDQLSCMPAMPLLLQAGHYCAWRGAQLAHERLQDLANPPSLAPEAVVPRLGLWLHNHGVAFTAGKRWKFDFVRTGNLVPGRDCIQRDDPLLSVVDPQQLRLARNRDAVQRAELKCATTVPESKPSNAPWWKAARDPSACGDGRAHHAEALQGILPEACGAYCVLHPRTRADTDHGWALVEDEGRVCWWYTRSMSTDPQCSEWVGKLYQSPFEWVIDPPKLPRHRATRQLGVSSVSGTRDLGPEHFPIGAPSAQGAMARGGVGASRDAPRRHDPAGTGTGAGTGRAPSPNTCDEILPGVCGPQIIIGGAMKCGTNTLGNLLAQHPRVKLRTCEFPAWAKGLGRLKYCNDTFAQGRTVNGKVVRVWESHYFTHRTANNPDAYMDHGSPNLKWFANLIAHTDGQRDITFEKAPSYLDLHEHPHVAEHIKRMLPHAKIIFSVCDPAERLFSEFNHVMKWEAADFRQRFLEIGTQPPRTFSEFISLLGEASDFCRPGTKTRPYCQAIRRQYHQKGAYAANIDKWFGVLGRENVLVLDMMANQVRALACGPVA